MIDTQPCYPISLILLCSWTRVKILPWNNSMLKITSEKRARSSHFTDNLHDLKMPGAQMAEKLSIHLIKWLENWPTLIKSVSAVYSWSHDVQYLSLYYIILNSLHYIVLHYFKQSNSTPQRVSQLKYQKPCLIILWLQPSFNIRFSHSSKSAKHSKLNFGYIQSRTSSA